MKPLKLLSTTALAVAIMSAFAFGADPHEKCCLEAKKAGKECDHPCCVAAHKDGKECAKCMPKKEDKKPS